MRYAALNGDIWSTYAQKLSSLEELGPRIEMFRGVCETVDRDPASIGRAAGLSVRPLDTSDPEGRRIAGSAEQMADAFRSFREAGYTQVDLMVHPGTVEAFDALAPVVEMLAAD